MGRGTIKHLVLDGGQEGKRCSRCKEVFPLSLFGPCKVTSDLLSSNCRTCQSVASKISKEKTPREIWLAKARTKYGSDIEKSRRYAREYNATRSVQLKETNRKSYAKNREKRLLDAKTYRLVNREVVNEQARRYREEKKIREGVKFNLCKSISEGIRQSLKSGKKRSKWETLVNFNAHDLYLSLENRFEEGMMWSNYGIGCGQDRWWEIDHIKGIRHFTFNSQNDREFRECWSLTNLRPRWKDENRAWKLDDRQVA